MPGILTKEAIIRQLENIAEELTVFCTAIPPVLFFQQPPGKWSIAQNVKHLMVAADTTRLAFSLPKLIVRIYAGKPNRPSRSYDELVAKYKLKLEQGGRASGRYVPKTVSPNEEKEKMLAVFLAAVEGLRVVIRRKWKDPQLDQYVAPHPLLGKITLRELCYFTIYHTQHHLNIIKERVNTPAIPTADF